MMGRVVLSLCAGASVITFAGLSSAQDYTDQRYYSEYSPGYVLTGEQPVRRGRAAPANALELSVGFGYSQPFGEISAGTPSITSTADAGGSVEAGIGYRVMPSVMLGFYGSGGLYSRDTAAVPGSDIWTATAGLQANWHILPYKTVDPWLGLGVGWRGMWISSDTGTDSLHGLDILRGQIGLDIKVAPMVAIAPVIGATMTMFLTREPLGAGSFSSISDPRLNTFIFAGMQGRFDVPLGEQAVRTVAKR